MVKAIDIEALRGKHASKAGAPRGATGSASPDLRLGAKDGAASGQMNIRVSENFRRLLGEGARELGISMAQLVEDAVRDYLTRKRKR